jgi:protein-S-isoprenylcysteine O-methyltransferase Ste14
VSRLLTLLFTTICYAIFLATFLYLIVFIGDFSFADRTVDVGSQAGPPTAAIIDLGLIALFGLQHSVMARPSFKAAWTKIMPHAAERSFYVLAASMALIILFRIWHPIDTIVWNVTSPIIQTLIWAIFWLGWAIVLMSTFLINHFELFGLQQGWLFYKGRKAPKPELRHPFLYRWVAHPLYSGFFLAFWATPEMTVGHAILAAGMSVYMLIAIRYEERDLTRLFGDDYSRYRARVGALAPRISGGRKRPRG